MEFLKANYLNTTTQITVNSNTATASNMIDRDQYSQFYSDGLNNDATTLAITVTFDVTTPISRIAILDTNFKQFSIFYNGSTANTFSLNSADTTVSSYTGNTDENKFFRFSTVNCTSITINAKTTMLSNSEKVLGHLLLSDLWVELEKIPNAKGYGPKYIPKQIVHKLSDGGTRTHNVRSKWDISLKLEYVSTSQRDSLFEIFDSGSEFNFCPFGTATGWDAAIPECVWEGPFEFFVYADNATSAGFVGKVSLKETPS